MARTKYGSISVVGMVGSIYDKDSAGKCTELHIFLVQVFDSLFEVTLDAGLDIKDFKLVCTKWR